MIITLPDTNTTKVNKALVDLREEHGAIALGRVLTLVVVTVEAQSEAAIAAANFASHEHPCRVIGVVAGRGRGDSRLDAQIRVGGDAGASDVILLHTYGDLTDHPASVIMPLLLPDTPVVVWWPGAAPAVPAEDPVGVLAQRRITDAAAMRRPVEALEACRTGYRPGDTDLAWSRITLWRAILAAALDQEVDKTVESAVVIGGADSPSADLLAAWLLQALECPVERATPAEAEGLVGVELRLGNGSIVLDRAPDEDIALLATPGRPEQVVALQHRLDRECLAEELRRLDPDEVYGDVLTEGLRKLAESSGHGRHSRTRKQTTRPTRKRAATGRTTAKQSTRASSKAISKATSKAAGKGTSKAAGKGTSKATAPASGGKGATKGTAAAAAAKASAGRATTGKRSGTSRSVAPTEAAPRGAGGRGVRGATAPSTGPGPTGSATGEDA